MEHKIAVRRFLDEQGQPRQFHYFLLVRQAGILPFFCESYGVRIRDERGKDAAIPDLTTDPVAVDRLMTLLVDNLVGPSALSDVVEDWVGQRSTRHCVTLRSSPVRADPAFAAASPAGR